MIPGVPQVGGMELLILLGTILLFGAKRVPELGRSLGKSMREFRKGASEDTDGRENSAAYKLHSERELPPAAEETRPVEVGGHKGPREELSSMARHFGRFNNGAQRTAEDLKSEFVPEEVNEIRCAVKDVKPELSPHNDQDERRLNLL